MFQSTGTIAVDYEAALLLASMAANIEEIMKKMNSMDRRIEMIEAAIGDPTEKGTSSLPTLKSSSLLPQLPVADVNALRGLHQLVASNGKAREELVSEQTFFTLKNCYFIINILKFYFSK